MLAAAKLKNQTCAKKRLGKRGMVEQVGGKVVKEKTSSKAIQAAPSSFDLSVQSPAQSACLRGRR